MNAQEILTGKLLKIIGNRYRIHIINQLITGDKTVGELNASMDISQPGLSQHLNKLRTAKIVIGRRDKRNIYYSILNPMVINLIASADRMTELKGK